MADPAPNQVPVLFFDSKGFGPDELLLEIAGMSDMVPGRPQLGIRIRRGGMVIHSIHMIDGGYMLDRESVSKLYDHLTLWLVANPKPVPAEVSRSSSTQDEGAL